MIKGIGLNRWNEAQGLSWIKCEKIQTLEWVEASGFDLAHRATHWLNINKQEIRAFCHPAYSSSRETSENRMSRIRSTFLLWVSYDYYSFLLTSAFILPSSLVAFSKAWDQVWNVGALWWLLGTWSSPPSRLIVPCFNHLHDCIWVVKSFSMHMDGVHACRGDVIMACLETQGPFARPGPSRLSWARFGTFVDWKSYLENWTFFAPCLHGIARTAHTVSRDPPWLVICREGLNHPKCGAWDVSFAEHMAMKGEYDKHEYPFH